MKHTIRRLRALFTLDGFAVAHVMLQQFVVLIVAAGVVVFFVPLVGSFGDSYGVFMQSKALGDLPGWRFPLGLVELIIGIMIMSFIISLISSALNQFIDGIKKGTLGFKRSRHFVIINANDMLVDVLCEMNDRASSSLAVYDVVILVGDEGRVARVRDDIAGRDFVNLQIYVRQGDVFNPDTYRRINLCGATGVLLLKDSAQSDPFVADNNALKVLYVLAGWTDFKETIRRRMEEKNPVKFIVEMNDTVASKEIVSRLASVNGNSAFMIVHPPEVADRLLGRSIVDVTYYRIFEELFSFTGQEIYFMDPAKAAVGASIAGLPYKEVCFGFHRGIVIGLCRFKQGTFEILICPMDAVVQPGDWLILIAEDERSTSFDPTRKMVAAAAPLPQPPEIVRRRILMLGNRHQFPSLTDFLDEASRQIYRENLTVLSEPKAYFEPALIERIKSGHFDNIVINLEDELGFRLSAYVISMFAEDDPLLDRIISVMDSPITDEILNSGRERRSTILSGRICAKYLTQVLFQKTLDAVIRDLCSAKGYELNLLEVGKEFPISEMRSKDHVKQLLLGSDMAYLGIIDQRKNVVFDSDDLSMATKIIVLSKGMM